ncbi:hypothetical protein VZO05_07330 [Aggregatilineales bacterium SYSU G02658]
MSEENVFAINQPENVHCMVYSYQWGRANLVIRLKRQNSAEVQYIRFSGVEYFAGPMKWDNAAFDLRSAEECLSLLRDAGRANEHMTIEHVEQLQLRLLTVTLPNTLVCIVAKQYSRHSG